MAGPQHHAVMLSHVACADAAEVLHAHSLRQTFSDAFVDLVQRPPEHIVPAVRTSAKDAEIAVQLSVQTTEESAQGRQDAHLMARLRAAFACLRADVVEHSTRLFSASGR